MKLNTIKDTVINVADAIANVLDIDVIIVNTHFHIVGNTYKYMVGDEVKVDLNSIVGQCLETGKEQIYIYKEQSYKCSICEDKEDCIIKGVIAVPITYKDTTVGAIGIIISREEVQEKLHKDVDGIIIFLKRMADLLASKLESVEQMKKNEIINQEREWIISNVKDAMVYLDDKDTITYTNKMFNKYFALGKNVIGEKIQKVINHPIIHNYLYNMKSIDNEVFVLKDNNINFTGLITCTHTKINNEFYGTIMIFQKIEETYKAMNEILNTTSHVRFSELIDGDEELKMQIEKAKKAAIKDENIIIQGEKGTGKKTLAYAIHNFSNRKNNYLLNVNCRHLSREYYLSELFGVNNHIASTGKFQVAHKGTIVFEEITELPINIQHDLLSYLSTGKIELEKGVTIKNIDVRIIATTSYNILDKIKNGDFNEELYYRLNANNFHIKPLKQRERSHIISLIEHFIRIYGRIFSKSNIIIDDDAKEIMVSYEWENNISDLEKIIEKLISQTADGTIIRGTDVEKILYESKDEDKKKQKIKTFAEYEREIIGNALDQYKHIKNGKDIVAYKLDIGRATLYRKIRKYNL